MKISQPAPTVSDLWDAQVAALVTATSIGKLLVDNVDSPISTAKADLTTLEARLSAARAALLDNLDMSLITLNDTRIAAAIALPAILPEFQAVTATGTATNPTNVNDNNVATTSVSEPAGDYVEVDFGKYVKLNKLRYYGHANNNQDGEYKLEVYDVVAAAWKDWVLGLPTNLAAWSALTDIPEVITTKIRWTATIIDSGVSDSVTGELEVYCV